MKTSRHLLFLLSALACWPARAQPPYTAESDPSRTLDVPFVATPSEVVNRMLAMAQVTSDDVLYDLGCGDGRLVIAAAQQYGARALGVDLDPARVTEARNNARRESLDGRAQFKQGDLFRMDLRPATVLTLYLLPEVNLKLRPRILRQLRPGSRVVSHDFGMADWTPDAHAVVGDHTVYMWVVPAQVAGTWTWAAEGGGRDPYRMKVSQNFQNLTGGFQRSGDSKGPRPAPTVSDLQLAGDRVSFTMSEPAGGAALSMRYQGAVKGDAIVGSVELDGTPGPRPWRAFIQRR